MHLPTTSYPATHTLGTPRTPIGPHTLEDNYFHATRHASRRHDRTPTRPQKVTRLGHVQARTLVPSSFLLGPEDTPTLPRVSLGAGGTPRYLLRLFVGPRDTAIPPMGFSKSAQKAPVPPWVDPGAKGTPRYLARLSLGPRDSPIRFLLGPVGLYLRGLFKWPRDATILPPVCSWGQGDTLVLILLASRDDPEMRPPTLLAYPQPKSVSWGLKHHPQASRPALPQSLERALDQPYWRSNPLHNQRMPTVTESLV